MPTLVRLGRVSIRVFYNDHAPPHFHVATPDGGVLVRIETLTVIAGMIRRTDLELALEWARGNMDLIRAEWRLGNA